MAATHHAKTLSLAVGIVTVLSCATPHAPVRESAESDVGSTARDSGRSGFDAFNDQGAENHADTSLSDLSCLPPLRSFFGDDDQPRYYRYSIVSDGTGIGERGFHVPKGGRPGTGESAELIGKGAFWAWIWGGGDKVKLIADAGPAQFKFLVDSYSPVWYGYQVSCPKASCAGDYILRWTARSDCGAVQVIDILWHVAPK